MRILVVTHDLTERNAHLMPWRTVCEVVCRSRERGFEARLLSFGDQNVSLTGYGIPSDTISIVKHRNTLKDAINTAVESWPCDVIVWPLVWREPAWRVRVASGLGIPLVGYFPGGVYRLVDTLYAAKRIGLRNALPYIAEAVYPKSRQVTLWKKLGFIQLIAMTELTADAAIKNGWAGDNIEAIPPGRDVMENPLPQSGLPAEFREWRGERPYYLFAGPPSGIRGIYELLESFERVAEKNNEACLVCLFRSDAPLESERLKRVISNMKFSDRIYVTWESVGKAVYEAFLSECHAVVLPFVTVPSEIPLAIIETMRYEKPVITTMTGGTGDWVRSFGVAIALGATGALAESMLRLLLDNDYYKDRCNAVRMAYLAHPTWDDMTDKWLACISGKVGQRRSDEH